MKGSADTGAAQFVVQVERAAERFKPSLHSEASSGGARSTEREHRRDCDVRDASIECDEYDAICIAIQR